MFEYFCNFEKTKIDNYRRMSLKGQINKEELHRETKRLEKTSSALVNQLNHKLSDFSIKLKVKFSDEYLHNRESTERKFLEAVSDREIAPLGRHKSLQSSEHESRTRRTSDMSVLEELYDSMMPEIKMGFAALAGLGIR